MAKRTSIHDVIERFRAEPSSTERGTQFEELMVSYFEDVPLEMEEAALLDRAGRLRALWHVILPQVRGGKVKGLGVTSAERSAAAPDIPATNRTTS